MSKIILFYKYIDITYPVQVQKWQMRLCKTLGLKGRVIIASEGINGTLAGDDEAIEAYKKALNENPTFAAIDFKESAGSKNHFPRLRVVVKKEICHLGLDTQEYNWKNGGIHLTPEQAHAMIQENPKLLLFDARNSYESSIGTFENSLVPDIEYFRQLPGYIDNNTDEFKDKDVLMFCTGGIRCERASSYLKSKNVARNVYQIKGGIHRYIEQFPDGFFRGKNYVFDGRVALSANDDVIGSCTRCGVANDDIINCINASCNKQFIVCNNCRTALNSTCSETCAQLVAQERVVVRTNQKRVSVD